MVLLERLRGKQLLRLASFTQLALFGKLLVNGSDLSQNLGEVVDPFPSRHSIAVDHENHGCRAWDIS